MRPADPFRGRRWADANRTRARSPVDPDLEPGDAAEPGRGHRRAPVPVHRRHAGVLLAIAAGGFLGALARYELELTWPPHSGTFPASTFVINTSGAFLLGLVLTVSIERDRVHARRAQRSGVHRGRLAVRVGVPSIGRARFRVGRAVRRSAGSARAIVTADLVSRCAVSSGAVFNGAAPGGALSSDSIARGCRAAAG